MDYDENMKQKRRRRAANLAWSFFVVAVLSGLFAIWVPSTFISGKAAGTAAVFVILAIVFGVGSID